MMPKADLILLIVVLAIAGAIGGGVTWYFTHQKPVVETAAPEVRQADGSVQLQRAPDANAKPAQIIPKGAKIIRIAQVTVQGADASLKLPPVTVDMTLVRLLDRSQRVVASSPDGQIVGGVDIPVETAAPEDTKKWAAGLSYDVLHQTPGVWIERDVWRARLGIDLNQTRVTVGGPSGVEARLRVGVTF